MRALTLVANRQLVVADASLPPHGAGGVQIRVKRRESRQVFCNIIVTF